MIITAEFYGVECNNCKNVFEEYEYSYWNDMAYAVENATESGWHVHNTKSDVHYCEECFMGVLFDKWLAELKEIAIKEFNYAPDVVFDRDTWHDYYIDDVSPKEALIDTASHSEKS